MDPHYDNNVDNESDTDSEYDENDYTFQDVFPLYMLTLNKVTKIFQYLKNGGSFIRHYQIVSRHIPVTECERTEIVRRDNKNTYVNSFIHDIPYGCSITTKVSNRVYIKEVHNVFVEYVKFQYIMNSINVDFPISMSNFIIERHNEIFDRYCLDLGITGDSFTIDITE